MNSRRVLTVFVIVLFALALTTLAAGAQEEPAAQADTAALAGIKPISPPYWNMLLNSSFETGGANPDGWVYFSLNGTSKFKHVTGQAVLGSKSVKIVSETPDDARWRQIVAVQPNTDYVLSGWIKTLNVGHSQQAVDAGANLSIEEDIPTDGPFTRTPALYDTHDWTYVYVPFNSGVHSQLTISARIGMFSGMTTGTAWFDNVQVAPIKKLYLSSSQSGTVGGVKFAPADILVHNPVLNTWEMYFDGSDVGITKNLDCLEIIHGYGGIIFSLQSGQVIPGFGRVEPQDLIVFDATSVGPDTAGTFRWEMDGSRVGLDSASENIDACAGVSYNVISTNGATDIVYDGRDEDLFSYGNGGYYWMWRLDGSDVPNLAAEDVWGHSWGLANTSDVYLSTQDTYFPGNGRSFTNKQIFVVHSPWPELFWDGPSHGFRNVIDGFSIER